MDIKTMYQNAGWYSANKREIGDRLIEVYPIFRLWKDEYYMDEIFPIKVWDDGSDLFGQILSKQELLGRQDGDFTPGKRYTRVEFLNLQEK